MVKQIQKLKEDHSGSSLVMVIFCMVFIGILASAILTATVSNMKMKTVDAFAKDNFYTAEMAMDELKLGLEETANNTLKQAYAEMLNRYSVTPETERSKKMQVTWANLFFNALAKYDNSIIPSELEDGFYDKYIVTSSNVVFSAANTRVEKHIASADPTDKTTVTMKDVTLTYTDLGGYETTITTDLKFAVDSAVIGNQAASHNGIYFTDYALIAEEKIQNLTNSTATVNANVYGGGGILAKQGVLNLNSKTIVSRNSLEAMNKGKIVVSTSGGAISEVWVKDIVTTRDSVWDPSTETPKDYLSINADCYVADDLTLDAKGGNVKINGNYYGFNSDVNPIPSVFTSDASSSIIVNTGMSTLDLSGLNRLWIAGKNFLSVPSVYGVTSTSTASIKVAEGESLSFKGSQVAYLFPGSCIIGIGHNPMTVAEYDNLRLGNPGYSLDFTQYKAFDITPYLHATVKYKAAPVNFVTPVGTNQMVYLYLNFKDPNYASDYLQKYIEKEGIDKINKLADDMGLADVMLPDYNKIVNTGNLMRYSSSSVPTYRERLDDQNNSIVYSDSDVLEKEKELTASYYSLFSYLEKRNTMTYTDSLVKTIVRFDDEYINGILKTGITGYPTGTIYEKSSLNTSTLSNPYILVEHQPQPPASPLVITGTGTKYGIIITTRDVSISGCDFVGMIITLGNITIGGDCTVSSDKAAMKEVVEKNPTLYEFFKDYDVFNASIESSVVTMSYENWYKN